LGVSIIWDGCAYFVITGGILRLCSYCGRTQAAEPWRTTRQEINLTIRKKRNFRWMIDVAADEKIIKPGLKPELHELRDRRNAVHIAELAAVGEAAGINVSKTAYRVMHTCVETTGHWMTLHP
jgi:hypothetical protein